jgi:ribonuclease BN (tRNA processing enzyme)
MLRSSLDPLAVDRIFFTHFHPDHTVDVVPLLFAINYGAPEKRTLPLYLTGPEPFLRFWRSVMEVWGEWMAGDYATLVGTTPRMPIAHRPHRLPAFVGPGGAPQREHRLQAGIRRRRVGIHG